MKERFLRFVYAAMAFLLFSPALAMARQQTPDKEIVDGRLEGYSKSVTIEGGSTALTWILLVFLTAICVSVMFKNAKRTHLD